MTITDKTETAIDTSPGILERALDAIPGRRELKDAERRLRKPPTPASGGDCNELLATLYEQLLDGADLPEDLGERWLNAAATTERNNAAHAAWQKLRQQVRSELEQVEANGDDALRFLAGELDVLLGEVRQLDGVLGSVASADDAVRAGDPAVGQAWVRLEELLDHYDRLTAAQVNISAGPGGNTNAARQLVETVGRLRNYVLLNPERAIRAGDVVHDMTQMTHGGNPVPMVPTPSWPDAPTAYLRWLATSPDADPWVPTKAQLQAAEQERLDLRRQAENDRANGSLTPEQRRTRAQKQERAVAQQIRAHQHRASREWEMEQRALGTSLPMAGTR